MVLLLLFIEQVPNVYNGCISLRVHMCVHYVVCTHVLVYKSWGVMGVVLSQRVSWCGV